MSLRQGITTSSDTIAAIASPPGRASIGVIRVSGSNVTHVARSILGTLPAPRLAYLSRFRDADGEAMDLGLALYFAGPMSFTGEDVLELQGHGGPFIMDLVLKRVLELGCRLARPGEFSERAFLNGKMDIAQAEAVADLIDAGTSAAARAAVRSMQGEFSRRIHELRSQLTALRAYVEAAIDFPDEPIDVLSGPAVRNRLTLVFENFDSVAAAARQGALLRDGLTVVIAGKPNAGKSSLLNSLVGDEVAIVNEEPGTTRDLLRQHVHLDGMPLHLIDTAGLHKAANIVEEEGIRRAKTEMRRADLVLYLIDASVAESGLAQTPIDLDVPGELRRELVGIPITRLLNKIDLLSEDRRAALVQFDAGLLISARTGAGIDELRAHLKVHAGFQESPEMSVSARRRHLDAVARARAYVKNSVDVLNANAWELFAEDLRLAQQALGEITGEFTSDDLLGEIFGSFCIGK